MLKPIQIYELLKKEYPGAKISLDFENPLQLLVATILSAQCTDARVNVVTKPLFKRYKTATDYAEGDIDELKAYIRSTGFYNAKAKHIQEACRILLQDFDGKVPETMEDLLTLPGVARKTANVVLSNAYGKNYGIAVDTHMIRLNYRMGFTKEKSPEKIEKDLMAVLPKNLWNKYTYYILEHGRNVCKAPTPVCSKCVLKNCPRQGVTIFK
ncbi:MAG: endonuclease III [Nanoarchaeota archaeon]|nr:endonuclease III [Nanoarchaeota archaeon]